MKYYESKNRYKYKEYTNGKKVRISDKDYYKNINKIGGSNKPLSNKPLISKQLNNGNTTNTIENNYNNPELMNINIGFQTTYSFYIYFIKLSINKNYLNENNFTELKVRFEEDVNLNDRIIIKRGEEHILNENFYINYGLSIHYTSLNNKIGKNLNLHIDTNFKKIFKLTNLCSNYDEYEQPSVYFIFNKNLKNLDNYDYKIHISINPYYLNESLNILFNSEFYKNQIRNMKIFLSKWIYFYKSNPDWEIWQHIVNANHHTFIEGIGYIVLYLTKENLKNLIDFIEYWKTNFENNSDKYRDKNYIKFNIKLTNTLYLSLGGETSSKIQNKKSNKLGKKTKPDIEMIAFFNFLINKYKNNNSKINEIKIYLKEVFSIEYDIEQLLNFKYFYNKKTPEINLLQYKIKPFNFEKFEFINKNFMLFQKNKDIIILKQKLNNINVSYSPNNNENKLNKKLKKYYSNKEKKKIKIKVIFPLQGTNDTIITNLKNTDINNDDLKNKLIDYLQHIYGKKSIFIYFGKQLQNITNKNTINKIKKELHDKTFKIKVIIR